MRDRMLDWLVLHFEHRAYPWTHKDYHKYHNDDDCDDGDDDDDDGDDEFIDIDINGTFLTFQVTEDGVLDLSNAVVDNPGECPISPWAFAGLDEVRGVRELRMSGYGRWFYPIGYAGTVPGPPPVGKPVPRPLQPLVPPGAPLRASLRVLDLSGNYFDSLGVFLDGLANLEVLHLDDTNIADVHGLAGLANCPNIRVVTLRDTLLDDALLAKLGDDGHAWRDLAME